MKYYFEFQNSCTLASFKTLSLPRKIAPFFNIESAAVYACWFALQAFLAILPVGGRFVKGMPTPSGSRLSYRCNGKSEFTF